MDRQAVRTLTWYVLFALFTSLVTLVMHDFLRSPERQQRCDAAQQTILEEADLISAAGKFPREKITNRWKALLEGCQ